MRLIAHRGNIDGPDSEHENDPVYVLEALAKGFDCEIDVHYIKGQWFLGHDAPGFLVPENFFQLPGLWVHCKNIEAVYTLQHSKIDCHWFWHETDRISITSKGKVWTCDKTIRSSILMIPDIPWTDAEVHLHDYNAICNDWVSNVPYRPYDNWAVS